MLLEIEGITVHYAKSLAVENVSLHVPEGRQLFPYLTVLSNLKLGATLRKDREIDEDLEEVYHLFPILKQRLVE
jgi:branched-chain amino acid transport system ATP-binding protein